MDLSRQCIPGQDNVAAGLSSRLDRRQAGTATLSYFNRGSNFPSRLPEPRFPSGLWAALWYLPDAAASMVLPTRRSLPEL